MQSGQTVIEYYLATISSSLGVIAEVKQWEMNQEQAKIDLVVQGKKSDILEAFKSGKEFSQADLFREVKTYREHLSRCVEELVSEGLLVETFPGTHWRVNKRNQPTVEPRVLMGEKQ